jgi:hypothetical protein
VRIDVVPEVSDPERTAMLQALTRAGIDLGGKPAAHSSRWLRTGLREAVGALPAPPAHARSPRSTRGATRA